VTPDEPGTVEVAHRVPCVPAVVFPYFTDPEKYRRWKGLEAELDPRPGGIYRVQMLGGVSIEGEYLVVEPPRRLVFSWGWRGDPLPVGMAEVPPGSTKVEVLFEPDGDGTIVRLRHTGLPTEAADRFHRWGWETYLGRLEIAGAGGEPGPLPIPGPDLLSFPVESPGS
jgi:uncharacterized protein YndB with AHSA1/START domain